MGWPLCSSDKASKILGGIPFSNTSSLLRSDLTGSLLWLQYVEYLLNTISTRLFCFRLSLSVEIAILFRCIHHWNLWNYSKGHRSTQVSRHNLRHWGSIDVSGAPEPYLPFLKTGISAGEARNTHAESAIANRSEECSCLGRTAMDFCSISDTLSAGQNL